MRIVQLHGGAVAFETDQPADHIDSLDLDQLRKSGLSNEAIRDYEQYRDGSKFLRRVARLLMARKRVRRR